MLVLTFFNWWYGRGWRGEIAAAKRRLDSVGTLFSVAILLRTLFSPWRRIISYPGAGFDAHLRAMLDNLVSRVIGFVVRISVLMSAAVIFVLLAVVGLVQILLWPLLPLLSITLIVWGLLPA